MNKTSLFPIPFLHCYFRITIQISLYKKVLLLRNSKKKKKIIMSSHIIKTDDPAIYTFDIQTRNYVSSMINPGD